MTQIMYETGNREVKCDHCPHIIGSAERRWWNTETRRVICDSCYNEEQLHNTQQAQAYPQRDLPSPSSPSKAPPSSPPVDRNAAIAKGHDENMKSAELNRLALQSLTSAIVDLMRVEADRNELLKKGLEAKA